MSAIMIRSAPPKFDSWVIAYDALLLDETIGILTKPEPVAGYLGLQPCIPVEVEREPEHSLALVRTALGKLQTQLLEDDPLSLISKRRVIQISANAINVMISASVDGLVTPCLLTTDAEDIPAQFDVELQLRVDQLIDLPDVQAVAHLLAVRQASGAKTEYELFLKLATRLRLRPRMWLPVALDLPDRRVPAALQLVRRCGWAPFRRTRRYYARLYTFKVETSLAGLSLVRTVVDPCEEPGKVFEAEIATILQVLEHR